MRKKFITELTSTQIEYISKKLNNSIKFADNNDCYIKHYSGESWEALVTNIKTNRFYLHNLTPKYFVLDSMTINENSVEFQFSLTKKFFKEII